MWEETKQGLHKRFMFADFHEAWSYMEQAHAILDRIEYYPRWQNKQGVVEFWLMQNDTEQKNADLDWQLAQELDELAEHFTINGLKNVDEKNTTQITEIQLYADGGSRGNPGPSASGYVLLDMSGNVLCEQGIYLGITTNNQAEYQALKFALEAALQQFRAKEVHVYMDSMLVINQMKNIFKVRNRDLWPVHDAINQLIKKFDKVSFNHVPREFNKLADAEVNKCLDAHETGKML